MPGTPIPIFFVVTFFAYDIEQAFHGIMRPLRANFYKGSGHTETYWVLAVIPALCLMAAIWIFNGFLVWWLYQKLVSL
jgi:fatty acid desaturase